jgi:hypothetical protein
MASVFIPATQVLGQTTNFISSEDAIRTLTQEYFQTVHQWLPIISRKQFHEFLICPPSARRIEIVLLLYCMKLIITFSENEEYDPKSPLYHAVKRLFDDVESLGIFSLQALQAKVLLTYYELGHAIYPAAYLAAGYCARYGIALGLHNEISPATATMNLPFDEAEQKRRTWWAILILDRYVNYDIFPSLII